MKGTEGGAAENWGMKEEKKERINHPERRTIPPDWKNSRGLFLTLSLSLSLLLPGFFLIPSFLQRPVISPWFAEKGSNIDVVNYTLHCVL